VSLVAGGACWCTTAPGSAHAHNRPPPRTPTRQLVGKTDEGFVKGAFRLARDHLGVRTPVTPAQCLEQVQRAARQMGGLRGHGTHTHADTRPRLGGAAFCRCVVTLRVGTPWMYACTRTAPLTCPRLAALTTPLPTRQGFALRKVLLLCDVVAGARQVHAAGAKAERAKQAAAHRQVCWHGRGRVGCGVEDAAGGGP
jgi:hypothetical protein